MEIFKADVKFSSSLKKRNETDAIVIHCSATQEGIDFGWKEIDRCHKDRGFAGVGYHFLIYRDGSVYECRPADTVGAHANTKGLSGKSYNSHSIGICYIGGLDKNLKPKDTRTEEQKAALRKLVFDLMDKYPNITDVLGHRDTSPDLDGDGEIEPHEWIKACPCFDVRAEFPMAVCRAKKTK